MGLSAKSESFLLSRRHNKPDYLNTHPQILWLITHAVRIGNSLSEETRHCPSPAINPNGEELYKLHASVLILILLFQFVFTMYKLI